MGWTLDTWYQYIKYIWALSIALLVSTFLQRSSTQSKWVVTSVDSVRLCMVIDMIGQLGRHLLYQFIIGCEDSKRFPCNISPTFFVVSKSAFWSDSFVVDWRERYIFIRTADTAIIPLTIIIRSLSESILWDGISFVFTCSHGLPLRYKTYFICTHFVLNHWRNLRFIASTVLF